MKVTHWEKIIPPFPSINQLKEQVAALSSHQCNNYLDYDSVLLENYLKDNIVLNVKLQRRVATVTQLSLPF